MIEDDARLARVIARVLQQEHFDVDLAHDGETGLDQALTGAYDALIVDWMLPGRDGVAIVRELRAEHVDTPALMLTARGEMPQRVEGLNAGADDYLGKPFAFEELLARLRALLRRGERPLLEPVMTIGEIAIDFASHAVSRGGQPVPLSPREFALLELLARHRGQVLSRDQILERVWGFDADPRGNVVDLYIHYLRRKLDPDGQDAQPLIQTIRGAGYLIPAG
ncbi:MAG: response regulator transcription factor [Thermomicrobiales bacterium]|nr:response regulator transcription factor [Thermomicrobiales bacterium]